MLVIYFVLKKTWIKLEHEIHMGLHMLSLELAKFSYKWRISAVLYTRKHEHLWNLQFARYKKSPVIGLGDVVEMRQNGRCDVFINYLGCCVECFVTEGGVPRCVLLKHEILYQRRSVEE